MQFADDIDGVFGQGLVGKGMGFTGGVAGLCRALLYVMHEVQFTTTSLTSCSIQGHQTHSRHHGFIFLTPYWASCAWTSRRLRRAIGTTARSSQ